MSKIFIEILGHQKKFDIINATLLFWPGSKIIQNKRQADISVFSKLVEKDNNLVASARIRLKGKYYSSVKTFCSSKSDDVLKYLKQTVFFAASKATGIIPPWGILTGIRPMSVYEKLALSGQNAGEVLQQHYFVSEPKRKILDKIWDFRQSVYYDGVKNDVSLYVSIPFCPSKCYYCSFVSSSIEKVKKLIDPYLKLLQWEITQKIDLIHACNKQISTVYIGGGTPGILFPEQMDQLLGLLFSKINYPLNEFCFEFGRPETVTIDKLTVLKKYPIDRLCINCQTLNNNVLEEIGRKHTANQFIEAFKLARSFGFWSINVDFIAGLPNESIESHISSLNQVIDLKAENITVHTLSIKKANTWKNPDELYDAAADPVKEMLLEGYRILENSGYMPYYIYRQKSTLNNGENIGYSKPNHIGKYNIYMMEDVHTVIGCGAGASTKIIHTDNGRIDRFVNTKYPQEYLKFTDKLSENIELIAQNMKGNN